jgi:PAS domain S-box-containing protein
MADVLQPAVFDALNAGLIVLDRSRRILHWNAWMAAASGRAAEAVRGKTLTEVFPHAKLSRLGAAVDSAFDAGVSGLLTHALHPSLFPLKTRSGRALLHDVTVSTAIVAPGPVCLIHVADVTMAVRRERYLRDRQNARYDAVVASAPDGILTLDGDGVIRFANPSAVRQFGYSEEELVNRPATTLFAAEGGWGRIWQGVVNEEAVRLPAELLARRKDGTTSHVEVSASRWQDSSHVFVTVILRDINERRAAESALRASERHARTSADALAQLNATLEQRVHERTTQLLKVEEALRQSHKMEAIGQLTGGIAHDFNTLLQGVIGALNIVQKRVEEGRIGDVSKFVKGALSSADRASALTHRLLAFSRRQPVDPRPVDVNQLIASMEELFRRSLGDNIRMDIVATRGVWLVRCDVNQMENALLNLVINARDAMPDGGTLTITTLNRDLDAPEASIRDLKPGPHLCLTIADTGIGMPPEVQVRAFDPFFTTKPIGQGTGLGLSMIYGFVRQSQGSVQITSEVGSGTAIEICLPRYEGGLEPDAIAPDQAGDTRSDSNDVVLVVEDEPIVRLLVVEVLNDLGYRPLEAGDGASALRVLDSAQRIDLLVTDIGLPDINGRQVADAGRVQRPNLKILFMTGYAESAASSEFLEKGMEIIGKPFTMERLAIKIREMIERGVERNAGEAATK